MASILRPLSCSHCDSSRKARADHFTLSSFLSFSINSRDSLSTKVAWRQELIILVYSLMLSLRYNKRSWKQ